MNDLEEALWGFGVVFVLLIISTATVLVGEPEINPIDDCELSVEAALIRIEQRFNWKALRTIERSRCFSRAGFSRASLVATRATPKSGNHTKTS